eukprot:gene9909-21242_t
MSSSGTASPEGSGPRPARRLEPLSTRSKSPLKNGDSEISNPSLNNSLKDSLASSSPTPPEAGLPGFVASAGPPLAGIHNDAGPALLDHFPKASSPSAAGSDERSSAGGERSSVEEADIDQLIEENQSTVDQDDAFLDGAGDRPFKSIRTRFADEYRDKDSVSQSSVSEFSKLGSRQPSRGSQAPSVWKLEPDDVKDGKEVERKVFFGMGDASREKNQDRVKAFRCTKSNRIKTSAYTLLSFVPQNLFEQFQKSANKYFLLLVILMIVPVIPESLPWYTMGAPLILVLIMAALKDGLLDMKRHKADSLLNNRIAYRRSDVGDSWEEIKWHEVRIGDIIKVKKNMPVPADMVLILSSESKNGKCNIETADLDGETNLKQRWVLPQLMKLLPDMKTLDTFMSTHQGYVRCDAPNTNLERFNGAFYIGDETDLAQSFRSTLSVPGSALENENTILRGSIVRHTEFAVGIVVYVGNDTKMMMNTGNIRFKRTRMDMEMDTIVWAVGGLLLLCGACGSIMCWCYMRYGNTLTFREAYNWQYREGDSRRIDSDPLLAGLHFFSYIIVMNTMIPISLYICVDLIRIAQSQMIDFDLKMIDPATGTPAVARTQSLNEELGQIEHLFSDKTGTLTQNVMAFRRCSIAGTIYGASMAENPVWKFSSTSRPGTGTGTRNKSNHGSRPGTAETDMSETSAGSRPSTAESARSDRSGSAAPQIVKLSNKLVDALPKPEVSAFFTLMAVCHTATAENEDGFMEYQSESPDEKALLDAAKAAGHIFVEGTSTHQIVEVNGEEMKYEMLDIIKFNSTRKRMTVICRCPDGLIRVFTKGADNIMMDRLPESAVGTKEKLSEHLNAFAREGLRTLVMAQKVLSQEDFDNWHSKYAEASAAVFEREEKMATVAELMEKDLDLIGCSAIEDKLQDGVPETIQNIIDAGIKIWVLTGDKLETAVNIGAACQLLTKDMEPYFIIDGETIEDVQGQLDAVTQGMADRASKAADTGEDPPPFGMVVTGSSLALILPPTKKELEVVSITGKLEWDEIRVKAQIKMESTFLRNARKCTSVLCCRVSPLQKSKVVALVKKREKSVTMAIGDGANDVSMIREAHIGIGISGLEGRQAVLSSDYSFGQFRFLRRLLFVHGRWSYYRIARFIRYFFYKSFAFTVCAQFFFAFYNGASAQTTVDAYTVSMYNVLFTSFPILVVGFMEQDVNERVSLHFPALYAAGPKQLYFSSKITFAKDITRALLHASIAFFFVVSAMAGGGGVDKNGLDQSDLTMLSVTLTFTLITLINAQLAIEVKYWTWFHFATITFGPLAWVFVVGILSEWNDWANWEFVYFFHGAMVHGMSTPQYWLIFVLVIYTGLFPNLMGQLVREHFYPNPLDRVRRMPGMGEGMVDTLLKEYGHHRPIINKASYDDAL